MRIKLLFFISIYNHGNGGHLYSLLHITSELNNKFDIGIISIGNGNTSIVAQSPFYLKNIRFSGLNLRHVSTELKKSINIFQPDYYHCFDSDSYNVIRVVLSTHKNKILVNKCGGPNPKNYPFINNLILFSQENFEWFKNNPKFKNTRIHLIPNRVKALILDDKFNPIPKSNDEFIFIRICRICIAYKKSIEAAINLVEHLHINGLTWVKLYIIGVVENENIYNELKHNPLVKSRHIIFLIDKEYTTQASKMLYLADAVIGTGRGLMESASLSIPLLTINSEGDIPVLLNSLNFTNAFKTNFSERNRFPNFSHTENLKNIKALVQNKIYYTEIAEFSKQLFDQYFNIDIAAELYLNSYINAITGTRKLIPDTLHIIHTFINFNRSYLKSQNEIHKSTFFRKNYLKWILNHMRCQSQMDVKIDVINKKLDQN